MSTMSSARSRGFTLTEMLVVIGVIVMFIGVSLVFDINNLRGNAFRAEVKTIITLLQTARADSLNNVDQSAHGRKFLSGKYVLFEGFSYASSTPEASQTIDSSYSVTLSPASPEVVFNQLSGDDIGYTGQIVVTDPQRGLSSVIVLNQEGAISW